MEHSDLLKELSKDGFLTMHENIDRSNGYVYLYSKHETEDVALEMRDELKKNFGILADDTYKTRFEGDITVKNGLIKCHDDGTFEDYLYKKGCPICITSETPIQDTTIEKRIKVNKALINIFIDNFKSTKKLVKESIEHFLKPKTEDEIINDLKKISQYELDEKLHANVNYPDAFGRKPLYWALKYSNKATELLKKYGAKE